MTMTTCSDYNYYRDSDLDLNFDWEHNDYKDYNDTRDSDLDLDWKWFSELVT